MGATNITTRAGLFDADPVHLDWTGAVTGSASVLWYVAIFRYRLLDLMPVARDVLVETMRDSMLVVDNYDRVVDANPAMRVILNGSSPVGELLEDVLPRELQAQQAAWQKEAEGSEEVELSLPRGVRRFDLRVLRLDASIGESERCMRCVSTDAASYRKDTT